MAESFFGSLKSDQTKNGFTKQWLKPSQRSLITLRTSTIEFSVKSISISLAPMSWSGSVKLRDEKCLLIWGNANLPELTKTTGHTTLSREIKIKSHAS